jgi:hypothetical protein
MFDRFMTSAYPRVDGCGEGSLHERAAKAARLVAENRHASVVPARGSFVARGAFPCNLHDQPPTCSDSRINACFAQLNIAAGDAVYVVGLMSPVGAVRAVIRYGAIRAGLALSGRRRPQSNPR